MQHLGPPPALRSSERSTPTGSNPAAASWAAEPGRLLRQHHVPPVADRVQAQHLGVFVLGLDQLGEVRRQGRPARVVKGRRVVGRGITIQDHQGSVEVIEARVDQPQADHRQAEQLGQLVAYRQVGAEPVPGQDGPAREHQVALALVDRPRRHDDRVTLLGEPALVGRSLGGPLGIPEPGPEHLAVDHARAVGREDHVRQPGDRRDGAHRVAQAGERRAQLLPLAPGPVGIHRIVRVHPGIDRVTHREVLGRAHQVRPGLRRGAQRATSGHSAPIGCSAEGFRSVQTRSEQAR